MVCRVTVAKVAIEDFAKTGSAYIGYEHALLSVAERCPKIVHLLRGVFALVAKGLHDTLRVALAVAV